MKKLIVSRLSITAFLLSYFSFFALTIPILEIRREGFGVGSWEYGYPFAYYYSGCVGGDYLWSGLIGNILFAAGLSAAVGFAAVLVWRNLLAPLRAHLASPEIRRKWYL